MSAAYQAWVVFNLFLSLFFIESLIFCFVSLQSGKWLVAFQDDFFEILTAVAFQWNVSSFHKNDFFVGTKWENKILFTNVKMLLNIWKALRQSTKRKSAMRQFATNVVIPGPITIKNYGHNCCHIAISY